MATYALGKIGMNLRGTYDASATYNKLDVVTNNGSSYAALQSCTGIPVTNTEYWQMLCAGNAESYTTDEVCTGGTWIDGKSIYRRVFVAENVTGADYSFAGAIEGLETVAAVSGMFYNQYGQFKIPYMTDGGGWANALVQPNKQVLFQQSGGIGIDKAVVVVNYTKAD